MPSIINSDDGAISGSSGLETTGGNDGITVFQQNGVERMRIGSSGVITSSLGGMQVISGTAVTASGTSIDFTSIPSWVKRITVMFSGVSTNGTSAVQIQLGSGSFTTSGYTGSGMNVTATPSGLNSTTGLLTESTSAAAVTRHGMVTVVNVTSNTWASNSVLGRSDTGTALIGGGSVTLSGTLDRIRITTVNGTDTFDAGTINILYE